MRKLLWATTALIALSALPARADVVLGGQTWFTSGATQLQLVNQVPPGNQPQNAPCIICGDNQPQQVAGFGYNDFGNSGNISTINAFSTAVVGGQAGSLADNTVGTGYQVGGLLIPFLQSIGDNTLTFSIGIDVNQAGNQPSDAQILNSFYFLNLSTHTVLASFTTDTPLPPTNQGTGFPDYFLTGLTLQGVSPGDEVIFFARMTNMSDGPDSFFLVPEVTAAVPEASTWMMMIAGFFGIGGYSMLRRRREGQAFRLA